MADWAKIAVKTGLIVTLMVAIWALFNAVAIPSFTFSSDMIQGVGFAKAVMTYWIPHSTEMLVLAFGIAAFDIGIFIFKMSMLAAKWIMKVNE